MIDWIVLADLVPGRELSGRAPAVDKDSLDGFLREGAPAVEISGRTLAFREFKDFRPEKLARQLPDVAALLGLRQQALDLAAGQGSAESLREGLRKLAAYPELASALEEAPKAPAPAPAHPAPARPAPPPSGSLFDLVDVEGSKAPAPPPETGLKGLLDEIVGSGRATGGPSPAALKKLAAQAEAAAGRALGSVLHHPAFRNLEAAWRGLRYFVRSLDFRAGCRLRVVPVPAGRLLRAVKEVALPLAEESRSQGRLAALLLDFALDPSEETAELARAAAARSVPVLASAAATPGPAWDALRSLEAARWLALVVNGFLLRAPYGKESDPVRDFPFEESGDPGPWGRPAWLLGALVSASVVRTGWGVDFAGREAAEALEALPVRPFEVRPGEVVQIPLEKDLGEAAARALDEAGLLPIACRRNSDRPFAAGSAVAGLGGGTLRDALFAAQVSATIESLLPNLDPTRSLAEVARTIGAGLELMGLSEGGPAFTVEASPAEDPPRALVRVRPAGPRLRGLADLSFEVPIPLR
jgi:type VI secretion system protein ImpC